METRTLYLANAQDDFSALLCPAAAWAKPTPGQIKALLTAAGLTQYEAGLFLGLAVQPARGSAGKGCRTVRRWCSGETPVPYAAFALLAAKAGFGNIWE